MVFGKLTVLSRAENGTGRKVRWSCLCACGGMSVVHGGNLRRGHTKSCGCYGASRKVKHGMAGTPEYRVWWSMKDRCDNPRYFRFKDYGGRGISVCHSWSDSFAVFLKDMGKRPSPKHSIDRIDNGGDYTPDNCKWSTMKEQHRNKRTNRLLTHNGKTQTVADWARKQKMHPNTITSRLRRGWNVSDSLTLKPTGAKQ